MEDLCFINPSCKPFGKSIEKREGCLSFPDIFPYVRRPEKCKFHAWDLHGNEIDEVCKGDVARIIQHEIDHLNGILFIDRLSDLQLKSEPIVSHLAAMERAWLTYPKRFPADAFNEVLYDYTEVKRPT